MKPIKSRSFNLSLLCTSILLLTCLCRAEEGRQATAASYLERGMSFVKKGELDFAIADFGIALQFDPNLAAALCNRGEVFYRRAEYARALSDLNRAIQINPRLVEAYVNRGAVRSRMGYLDGSISDHTTALALNPRFATA